VELSIKDTVIQYVTSIEKLDVPAIAAKVYPTQELDEVLIGPYNVAEIVALIYRVNKQFKTELSGTEWRHLPHDFTYPAVGSTTVGSCLSQVLSVLQQNAGFNSFLPYLQALIGYQMQYGFWDRSRLKAYDVKTVDLETKAQELAALTKQLAIQRKELTDGRALLETEKIKLVKFYEDKAAEFQRLTQQQQQGATLLQEINQFHTTGSTVSAKLDSLLATQQTNLAAATERQQEEQEAFEEFSTEHATLKGVIQQELSEFEDKKNEFDGHLTFAQETETYLQAKRDEINKLTSFAADGALGHSFNARRDTLNTSVKFWRNILPIATLGTLIWILVIFSGGFGKIPLLASATDNPWLNLLLNTLKTSPLVLFLLFTIKQYNRERNLQEEYAFRAAVAMTISAYADKLTTEPNKEKIILESVQRVYTSPRISAPDGGFGLRLPSKEVTELLKNLTDTIKELKIPAATK
jgi:hypothetical protein